MRFPRPAIFALGVVTTLIVGGTAYAANGGSLLIGRINQGSALTTLSNSNGTALALNSPAGVPSLKVNRASKVLNLNVDEIDGFDSTELSLKVGRTGMILGRTSDADGFAETARCPSGTYATGGGGVAVDAADHLWYSGPDFNTDTGALIPNSWLALADGSSVAWLVCYNPRGGVPGATTSLGAASIAGPAAAAHLKLGK
jgi:hypothetical protein